MLYTENETDSWNVNFTGWAWDNVRHWKRKKGGGNQRT